MDHFLTTDSSDIHNQAPGQVRGRATGGWPAGRIETLGQVEKDCRKAAPKEERVGKTCESNERLPARRAIQLGEERTSQIGRQESRSSFAARMLDLLCKRHSQASLRTPFHNISPLGNQAQPGVFRKISERSRAICVAEWAMGFQNSVQARLRRDLKSRRQLGLPKHSPACLCLHPCPFG